MKLRSRAGGLSTEITGGILGGKKPSDNKAIDKKENLLNKNYKLRAQNRSDSEKKLSNQNLKKLSRKNNKSENKVANYAVGLDSEGKENKIKKRPKRAVSQKCLDIKVCSSGSPISLQEKNNSSLENRKKVTDIVNINSNLRGKRCVTRKKNIEGEIIKDKAPLYEISNDHPVMVSDQENRFMNQIFVRNKYIIKHTEKVPIWLKKPNVTESKRGVKRKSFVDVYDISQDEDMSYETKHKKKKINSRKNVKKTVNKNKCLTISNKNTDFNKNSNTSKPVQNKLNKLTANQLSNDISSNPPTVKISTPAVSSNKNLEVILSVDNIEEHDQNCVINEKLEVILSVDNVEENSQNCVINKNLEVSAGNVEENSQNCVINKNLEVSADNGEKNSQNCVISSDDFNVTSEHLEIDKTCIDTKAQKDKKFLLNLADELEKSLIIPRMTSTPDSTMLNGPVIQHPPNNKLLGLNISSVHPKTKKCLKIPVKIGNSLSFKGAEITLFESPVKPKKKNHVKVRSPKKNIQIDLFNYFTEQSTVDDFENSVIEPKKAYHSPNNFKIHLARTKRMSELIKRDAKKTKEEKMIEKMAQHFEEVSSTELCIE